MTIDYNDYNEYCFFARTIAPCILGDFRKLDLKINDLHRLYTSRYNILTISLTVFIEYVRGVTNKCMYEGMYVGLYNVYC